MTCFDCAPLASRHESMVRETGRLRLDVDELERERAGLIAEIARQREQLRSLAAQVLVTP
jgi:hypothetical protein